MSSLDFERLRTQVCNGVALPGHTICAIIDEVDVLTRERDEARAKLDAANGEAVSAAATARTRLQEAEDAKNQRDELKTHLDAEKAERASLADRLNSAIDSMNSALSEAEGARGSQAQAVSNAAAAAAALNDKINECVMLRGLVEDLTHQVLEAKLVQAAREKQTITKADVGHVGAELILGSGSVPPSDASYSTLLMPKDSEPDLGIQSHTDTPGHEGVMVGGQAAPPSKL